MALFVVAVGKIRDVGVRAACEEYARRAHRSLRLRVREVSPAGRRGSTTARAMALEAEAIRAAVPGGAVQVGLSRSGEALSSTALADRIRRWRDAARDVAFLVGGADGLDPGLLGECDARLALSSFTLPHELARLVLLEQLYRIGTILQGHPYHKGTRR